TTRPKGVRRRVLPGMQSLTAGPDEALLYVPAGALRGRAPRLVVAFHGAGGDAAHGMRLLAGAADAAELAILAPSSHGTTWDAIHSGFGPDVARVDRLLAAAFARVPAAPPLLLAGFSDGASYALSLGLANGDLVGGVVAFSPGFVVPGPRHGRPRVYVSHGTADPVLPVDLTSRRLVPALVQEGYDVRYEEFSGGHEVPPDRVQAALATLLGPDDPATAPPGRI
ncbi:MAG TPA: hypothetical protein VNT51_13695, partial [Miltoncostaeaceae bacterium]|nr:hypothetical protein [Miltoncostaeaceae bacterium]